jgi:hypothetical protein
LAAIAGGETALAPGFPSFLRRKPMRRALAMGHLPTLASGDPSFLGRKLVRGPFLVGRFPTFAGNGPLFGLVHAGKASPPFFWHNLVPFNDDC